MFWKLLETMATTASRDAQSKSKQSSFLRRYVIMFSRRSNLFMALGGEVGVRLMRRATIVCITLIVIGVVQQATAVEMEAGTWTRKADMPTPRCLAGSAVVDGKIYVIGGAPRSWGFTAAVEEYDPATDTWTRRADMPTSRQVAAAAVDGIIYAIGGWNAEGGVLSTVEAYDPATDTWTKKADMPTARYEVGACVVDGRIYISGGATKFGDFLKEWACVPTVEVYDPATDTWTQASDMPWARHDHTASVVAGKMYIIGGYDPEVMIKLFLEGKEDKAMELFSTVDVYDATTDTWTTAADFPTLRTGPRAAVVDGKIYVIGGAEWGRRFSTVYEYDPGLPGAISNVSPAGKLLKTWGQIKRAQ